MPSFYPVPAVCSVDRINFLLSSIIRSFNRFTQKNVFQAAGIFFQPHGFHIFPANPRRGKYAFDGRPMKALPI